MERKNIKKFIEFLAFFLVFSFIFRPLAFGETIFEETSSNSDSEEANSLRELIDKKSVELQEIQAEREKLEKNIEETNKSKNSLTKEIKTIDYNINQLNLSIKANKLVLEKLGLEIGSLGGNIKNIEKGIQGKKETIGKLFVELQQKDRENLLMIFLRNKSLSDSVGEAQSIASINSNLENGVDALRELQYQLSQKLDDEKNKKKSREIEKVNLTNRQYIVQDQKSEKQKVLTQTQNQEKVYQQQIAELDKKQEEISVIIEGFERQLRASFDPTLLPVKRAGVLGFPVFSPILTQAYGATAFAARAYGTKFHTGVDFGVSVGMPILASLDGKIVAVDNNDKGTSRFSKFQYGKYIIIEHENNLSTLYAHLSRFTVQKGDLVKTGDIIGYSGNTGYATGPHLHFGVYWAPSILYKSIPPAAGLVPVGVTIDPKDYLPNTKP